MRLCKRSISEPFDVAKRNRQKNKLKREIRIWTEPNSEDPKKLRKVKQQFCDYEAEWFTCLDYEGVPCDNNKAERMLRHFVIKRKISFGTKTERTSDTFSVLASVFMTHWKKHQDNFFQELLPLCN
jgi:hypothetical protein